MRKEYPYCIVAGKRNEIMSYSCVEAEPINDKTEISKQCVGGVALCLLAAYSKT